MVRIENFVRVGCFVLTSVVPLYGKTFEEKNLCNFYLTTCNVLELAEHFLLKKLVLIKTHDSESFTPRVAYD